MSEQSTERILTQAELRLAMLGAIASMKDTPMSPEEYLEAYLIYFDLVRLKSRLLGKKEKPMQAQTKCIGYRYEGGQTVSIFRHERDGIVTYSETRQVRGPDGGVMQHPGIEQTECPRIDVYEKDAISE